MQTASQAREALKAAHRELNAIRARDGVPWTHAGYRSDVNEEYFSQVVDDCAAALAALSEPSGPNTWDEPIGDARLDELWANAHAGGLASDADVLSLVVVVRRLRERVEELEGAVKDADDWISTAIGMDWQEDDKISRACKLLRDALQPAAPQ